MDKQFKSMDWILLMNGTKYFTKKSSKYVKIVNWTIFLFSLYIMVNSNVMTIMKFKEGNPFTSIAATFNYTFAFINILTIKIQRKKMIDLFHQLHNSFDLRSQRRTKFLSNFLCCVYFSLCILNYSFYIVKYSKKMARGPAGYFLGTYFNDIFAGISYFIFYIYGCFVRQTWLITSISFHVYFVYCVDQLEGQLTELNIITFLNPSNCNKFMLFKKAIVGKLTVDIIKRKVEMALNFLPFLWTSFLFLQFNNVVLRIMKSGVIRNLSEIVSYSSNFSFFLLFVYFVNYLENKSRDKTEHLKAIITDLIYKKSSNDQPNGPRSKDDEDERFDNFQNTLKAKQYQKLFLNELDQPQIKYTGYDVFTIEKSLMIIFTGIVANYTTLFLQLK